MQHRKDPFLLGALTALLGSGVRLTEQTGDDQARCVTVKIEG